MNLYYLHYNNYYNRMVKKFDTLGEYLTLPYYDNLSTENIAFNPNDGTETEQVVNIASQSFNYDYALLADGNDIVSRWFIMKSKRLRNGQYRLNLRRDLFADLLEDVIDAPAFIEKATLSSNDPMIFNSEDMTFNQIKQSETLLKDETKSAWIVGYLASNDANGAPVSYNVSFEQRFQISDTVTNISDWDYYSYANENIPFKGVFNTENGENGFVISMNNGQGWYFDSFNEGFMLDTIDTSSPITKAQIDEFYLVNKEVLTGELVSELRKYVDIHTQDELTNLLNINDTYIKDSTTEKLYRVSVSKSNRNYTKEWVDGFAYNITSTTTPQLFNKLNSYFGNGNNQSFYMICNVPQYDIQLIEVAEETLNLTITENRLHLTNAPYDMFCIPYSDDLMVGNLKSSKQVAFDTAMALARKYGNEGTAKYLYDLQLLPYCPVRNCIQPDGTFDVDGASVFYVRDSENVNRAAVIFGNNNSFTFNIELENPISVKNLKIESACDMHRLCSPNYNGVFEFNVAKNRGLTNFNVDCTYKPYNPYIHMNPNFGGLYGQDFNDSRGLVVGGDFSLPIVTSAWESYQLSNKNFQASFDRQIQNMEVNNSIQMIQKTASAVSGTIQGVIGGAIAGGIGGAIAGGAVSAAAGVADVATTRLAQIEAIDYTKDQFGYSLGNIKALPQGLSKTSALTYNNKIFPFLEYYTCTKEEKTALNNKIKYNGMTVMRIGTIREFLQQNPSYIKGKLIRVTTAKEDFNYVNELANEFNKGVFI